MLTVEFADRLPRQKNDIGDCTPNGCRSWKIDKTRASSMLVDAFLGNIGLSSYHYERTMPSSNNEAQK